MNDIWIGLVGNVATTPKTAKTTNGHLVTSFRLASSVRKQDKETGQWYDELPSYLTVVCWRRLAENVSSSVSLGHPVVVYGRLKVKEWEREGRKGTNVEVEALAVGHDMTRGMSIWSPPRRAVPDQEAAEDLAYVVSQEPVPAVVEAPAAAAEDGSAEAA